VDAKHSAGRRDSDNAEYACEITETPVLKASVHRHRSLCIRDTTAGTVQAVLTESSGFALRDFAQFFCGI
jgi:hypothetical protein